MVIYLPSFRKVACVSLSKTAMMKLERYGISIVKEAPLTLKGPCGHTWPGSIAGRGLAEASYECPKKCKPLWMKSAVNTGGLQSARPPSGRLQTVVCRPFRRGRRR